MIMGAWNGRYGGSGGGDGGTDPWGYDFVILMLGENHAVV